MVGDHALRLRQKGRSLECRGAKTEFVRQYLALDHDLEAILSSIDRDVVIHLAIEASYGLRIVRQPLFECLVSYLCATNTNIPAVQRRVGEIAVRFGRRISHDDPSAPVGAYAFPTPEALGTATGDDLRACRLGYRAEYAERAITTLCDGSSWEDRIRGLSFEEGRRTLMALPGIGPKAADCICLFGLGHLEAFPVDLWVRRIVRRHYVTGLDRKTMTPAEYERIRRFGQLQFGRYAGYAQEYLYSARSLLCPG